MFLMVFGVFVVIKVDFLKKKKKKKKKKRVRVRVRVRVSF